MPLWVWNGRMNRETATRTLIQMKELGLGGVFIHPRAGMMTEFLSEEWFDLWGFALGECERLGLECHLYDENSFPSGFAGGHVVSNRPQSGAVALGGTVWDHPYRFHAHPCEEGNLAAFRLSSDGRFLGPASTEDLAQAAPDRPVVVFDLLREPASQWTAGYPYVDLLDAETTRVFLNLVHEAHARRFRQSLGRTWKYVFTDEPTLDRIQGLAASRSVLSEFYQTYGYELTQRLEGLAFNVPGAEVVRFDYFRLLDRLFTRNFCRQVFEWCEAHGVAFTGHFNEHAWPRPEGLPSTMSALRWMQVPGNDLLAFQFQPTSLEANATGLLNLKELSSVACQLGRKRVLAESCGGGGYGMAPRDFKPLEDFLLVHGVNLFSPHFSAQTVVGVRKYDWPQTFSEHSAWWEASRPHQDHVARVSVALAQGHEANRVLVLMPDTTAWIRWTLSLARPGENPPPRELPGLKAGMEELVVALTRARCDFDLGGETLLEEMGRVEEGCLICGEGKYELICLPEVTENVLSSLVILLREFLTAGGRVVSAENLPDFVDGRPSDALMRLAEEFPGQWLRCREKFADCITKHVMPRVQVESPSHPDLLIRRIETSRDEVLYYLLNPWDKLFVGRITLDTPPTCLLNTSTGNMDPFSGEGPFEVELGPREHLLLLARKETPVPKPSRSRLQPVVLTGPDVAALGPNVLLLDYCDLVTPGCFQRDVATSLADDRHWRAQGLSKNPWWFAIQFRGNTLDHLFPEACGFELAYAFQIASPLPLRLAVERPALYHVMVNGHTIDFSEADRWLDENILAEDITTRVVPGRNQIVLTPRRLTTECEIAPAYLLGNFHLEAAERGFEIHPPRPLLTGDWTRGGRPFDSGWVGYEWTFSLEAPARCLRVSLEDWAGTAARVFLDGRKACELVHPPFQAELAGPVLAGAHCLRVEVAGSPKNLFGPHFADGLPLHFTWTRCPEYCPPGAVYRFEPSGLIRLTLQQEPL